MDIATFQAAFGSESSPAVQTVIGGDYPRVTRKVTIASGAALPEGAVLGMITASGKYVLSASAAVDGSQTPVAILCAGVDAAAADAEGIVWFSGEFNAGALGFGAGHSAESTRAGLRALSIFI